ncbi:MAG: chromate transporter, partial [Proteobacteria bacterium]|nr:chromate transporter [Pseudomonadota bacterium]
MGDAAALGAGAPPARADVSVGRIFREFLVIGAISFGGAVPYLRGRLVEKRGWV